MLVSVSVFRTWSATKKQAPGSALRGLRRSWTAFTACPVLASYQAGKQNRATSLQGAVLGLLRCQISGCRGLEL